MVGVGRRVEAEPFDAVLLDVMLPDLDGFEVCRRIRAGSDIPILMLTARGDDADRIAGLEIGADDYLPKPFNPRELQARLRAILRRRRPDPGRSPPLRFGRLEIDSDAPADDLVRLVEAAKKGCFIDQTMAVANIVGHRLKIGEDWVEV